MVREIEGAAGVPRVSRAYVTTLMENLLVHTSFRAVRPIEGGPLGLIEALRAALGSDGTLVLPSWTGNGTVNALRMKRRHADFVVRHGGRRLSAEAVRPELMQFPGECSSAGIPKNSCFQLITSF